MPGSDRVVLAGGLSVPVSALRLAWQLEARGLHLRADNDGLQVGPRDQLTDDDRQAIRAERDDLLSIAKYDAPRVN
jgi:hypothetical protein